MSININIIYICINYVHAFPCFGDWEERSGCWRVEEVQISWFKIYLTKVRRIVFYVPVSSVTICLLLLSIIDILKYNL